MDALTTGMYTGILLLGIILGAGLAWLMLKLKFALSAGKLRADAVARSRSVLKGQLSEQIAPLLPDFPFPSSDLRFLGKPVDFVAFPGLSEGEPREIVLLEVKTGDARLTQTEDRLKELVLRKKVRWEEYRIP